MEALENPRSRCTLIVTATVMFLNPAMPSLRVLVFCLGLVATPALAQPAEIAATERGHAVRYEAGATGLPTSSGEPYNPERLTLAHPTLPFGTLVQLTNLANGQTVMARINDRAPSSETLRIQVSARTADHLGLTAQGGDVVLALSADEVALLEERAVREKANAEMLASVPVTRAASGQRFTVQLASFSDKTRAVAKADQLRGAWVQPVQVHGATVYRVCYGVFDSADRAANGRVFLQARGQDGFVKSLDAPIVRTDEAPVRPAAIEH